MLRKTKADIGKSPHQLFVLVCVSEIVAAVYQIIICYFTAHEHSVRGCFACSAPACGALRAVRFACECGRKKDLQPCRAVIHYDRNCILRSLRRFGRQGECGCKTPRVGHCEAAERRISQNTRRLQAFLPEPETAWLNEEISFGRFCCSCPPVPAGRNFLFQEEAT